MIPPRISNDGTPENGVVQGAAGRIDGADSFDGVDDSVNCGSSGTLTDLNPFTVEAWIYPDSYGQLNAGRVFDKANRILFVDGADTSRHVLDFYQAFSTTTGIWRTPTNSIQTGHWYHVAVSYNSSSAASDPVIYINGNPQTLIRSPDSGGFCRKRCR